MWDISDPFLQEHYVWNTVYILSFMLILTEKDDETDNILSFSLSEFFSRIDYGIDGSGFRPLK